MFRWKSFILGALTFLFAHFVLVSKWSAWFTSIEAHSAWFLNSERAAFFTFLCMFAAGTLVSALAGRERQLVFRNEASLFAGSFISMLVVLLAVGPGSIFPIVIAFGTAVIILGIAAGAFVGRMLILLCRRIKASH